jgi:hypothetical protein
VVGDVGDGGHKNDSEEGADVEDDDLFAEGPGEGEKEEDADAEDDVAADFSAGSLLVRGEFFGGGLGQRDSPWIRVPGADCLMQIVCAFVEERRKCGV